MDTTDNKNTRQIQLEGVQRIQALASTSGLVNVAQVIVDLLNGQELHGSTLEDASAVASVYIEMLVETFQHLTKRASFMQNLQMQDKEQVEQLVSTEFCLLVSTLFQLPIDSVKADLKISTDTEGNFTLVLPNRVTVETTSPHTVEVLAAMLISASYEQYFS